MTFSRVLNGFQGFSAVLKGSQGFSVVLKGSQAFSAVLKDSRGFYSILGHICEVIAIPETSLDVDKRYKNASWSIKVF